MNCVEYAILSYLGQGDQEYVYLPIDSKFPLADYYRLEKPMKQVIGMKSKVVANPSKQALSVLLKISRTST